MSFESINTMRVSKPSISQGTSKQSNLFAMTNSENISYKDMLSSMMQDESSFGKHKQNSNSSGTNSQTKVITTTTSSLGVFTVSNALPNQNSFSTEALLPMTDTVSPIQNSSITKIEIPSEFAPRNESVKKLLNQISGKINFVEKPKPGGDIGGVILTPIERGSVILLGNEDVKYVNREWLDSRNYTYYARRGEFTIPSKDFNCEILHIDQDCKLYFADGDSIIHVATGDDGTTAFLTNKGALVTFHQPLDELKDLAVGDNGMKLSDMLPDSYKEGINSNLTDEGKINAQDLSSFSDIAVVNPEKKNETNPQKEDNVDEIREEDKSETTISGTIDKDVVNQAENEYESKKRNLKNKQIELNIRLNEIVKENNLIKDNEYIVSEKEIPKESVINKYWSIDFNSPAFISQEKTDEGKSIYISPNNAPIKLYSEDYSLKSIKTNVTIYGSIYDDDIDLYGFENSTIVVDSGRNKINLSGGELLTDNTVYTNGGNNDITLQGSTKHNSIINFGGANTIHLTDRGPNQELYSIYEEDTIRGLNKIVNLGEDDVISIEWKCDNVEIMSKYGYTVLKCNNKKIATLDGEIDGKAKIRYTNRAGETKEVTINELMGIKPTVPAQSNTDIEIKNKKLNENTTNERFKSYKLYNKVDFEREYVDYNGTKVIADGNVALDIVEFGERKNINSIDILNDEGKVNIFDSYMTFSINGGDPAISAKGTYTAIRNNGKLSMKAEDSVETTVNGDFVSVETTSGDNVIDVEGKNARITTRGGYNRITLDGENSNIKCGNGNDVINIHSNGHKIYNFNPQTDSVSFGNFGEVKYEINGTNVNVKSEDGRDTIATFYGVSDAKKIVEQINTHNIMVRTSKVRKNFEDIETKLANEIGETIKERIDIHLAQNEEIFDILEVSGLDRLPENVQYKYKEAVIDALKETMLNNRDVTHLEKLIPKVDNIFSKINDIDADGYVIKTNASGSFSGNGFFLAEVVDKNTGKSQDIYVKTNDKSITEAMKVFVNTASKEFDNAIDKAITSYLKEVSESLNFDKADPKMYNKMIEDSYSIGKEILNAITEKKISEKGVASAITAIGLHGIQSALKIGFGKEGENMAKDIDTYKELFEQFNKFINNYSDSEYSRIMSVFDATNFLLTV